jgi:DNA replication protein DnaC
MIEQTIYEQIISLSKELKIPGIRKVFKEESESAVRSEISYEQYLLNLLEKEYDQRVDRRKKARIRSAKFPYRKYLEDLVAKELPADGQKKLKLFKNLNFIEEGQNIIMSGSTGTGKTHIAVGLGIKACLAGYKVLFVTVPTLITQLKESRSQRTLRTTEAKFEKYDLVIADELGYISFDKEGAELLFTNLSLRAGRKSTIITTNFSFDRWSEIFHDPVLTAAMVDRLTHKAHLVNMNGPSYRTKETQNWMRRKT